MKDSLLLKSNSSKRQSLSIGRLIPFSLFGTWQMGIIYFGADAFALQQQEGISYGSSANMTVISAGYIVSALLLLFFSEKSADITRPLLPVSFVCTAALFLPLSPEILAAFFAAEVFICVVLTGLMICTVVYWFTFDTEVLDLVVTLISSGIFTAVLQNDLIKIGFDAFTVASLIIQAALFWFYLSFRPDRGIEFASKKNRVASPSVLNVGLYLLILASCILLCFGSSFAESVKNGVSVYYLSGALFAGVFLFFYKKKKFNLISITTAFVAVSAIGFLLSAASVFVPSLGLAACLFLGAGTFICNVSSLLGLYIFSRNASRCVPIFIMLLGLSVTLIQSYVLELFRANYASLFFVYALIAVLVSLLYMTLSPYLIYAWKNENRKPAEESEKKQTSTDALAALSGQERRLAELILSGYSGSEIAEIMNITLGTMKNYRINMYQKLFIHSRRELFELVEKEGN